MIYDVAIIGAGVIGGMLARELSKYNLQVCLLEKENDVAMGASKANSGIIHGGYDPEPGTLKAKLNGKGVELLFAAAKELSVPCVRNGSMVCAFSEQEDAFLDSLYQRGLTNGTPGLSLLSGDEARQLEPNLSPAITKVLHVTNAGIISPYELTIAAIGNAMDNGVTLMRNFAVNAIVYENALFTVTADNGSCVNSKFLVNCAGCYSDKIAALAGDDFFSIIPRIGEYMLLDKSEGNCVSHTLFQCPTENGKGILVSPTAHGNLLVGPTAKAVESPMCSSTTADGLAQVEQLSKKTVPSLNLRSVITSFTGVRASTKDGEFIITPSKNMAGLVHAAAIDSPGLTCCVSIAKHLVSLLQQQGLPLTHKEAWNGTRKNTYHFQQMNDEEKDQYIKQHPAYGKIVCRCETISEGEIIEAIHTNPGARDIDGIKRRTRSGMGRCQGGFCSPYILKLLSRELGIPVEKVTKSGKNTYVVAGRIGEA